VPEITAVFENGILRPLSPLALGEGQQVRLQVLPELSVPEDELAIALQPLVASGLLVNPSRVSQVTDVSEADLRQLVESLKSDEKPLSEMIIVLPLWKKGTKIGSPRPFCARGWG
jgi:predicted DNA-binding antitoxin AbrB/MazE fold protein